MFKILLNFIDKYFELYEKIILLIFNSKRKKRKLRENELLEIIKHKDKQIIKLREENKHLFLMLQRITNENIELKRQLQLYNFETNKENENQT